MGEITGFGHFAVNVKDWEKTLWFYGNLLDLPLSKPVDMGDFNLVYASLPGGGAIELFQNKKSLNERNWADENTIGFRHFAFMVSDVASLGKKLKKAGIKITLDLTDLPKLGVKVLLCEEPNGITLEFSESLK